MPIRCTNSRYLVASFGLLLSASAAGFEPLSSGYATQASVPANVVILLDSSSSMAMTPVGDLSRLQVAREAIRRLLYRQRNTRFGLFSFNPSRGYGAARETAGGRLLVDVAGIAPGVAGELHLQRLEQALDQLAPDTGTNPDRYTWTPLAETHYEISRYLRGMDSFYNPGTPTYPSPLQWRCQPSAVLVVTDGLPTYDSQFPSSVEQEPALQQYPFELPDWDQDASNDVSGEDMQQPGSTFYLDDMAGFAGALDLRTGGLDAAGVSWDEAPFAYQQVRTHVLGFGVDDARLQAAARAGGGLYRTVDDAEQLDAALTRMVNQLEPSRLVLDRRLDALQLTGNEAALMRVYQHPQDGSGEVQLWGINDTGEPTQMRWTSDQAFAPGAPRGPMQTWRLADTSAGAGPLALDMNTLAQLSTEQQLALQRAAAALLPGQHDGDSQLLDWLRGEPVAGLRTRERLLGDLGRFGPRVLPAGAALAEQNSETYKRYRRERAQLGDLMLLGSNDGFLHVVGAGGKRHFSYLPGSLLATVLERAAVNYVSGLAHRAGVDGRIALADVAQGGQWRTLAATGLGAGGRGLLMLRLYGQAVGEAAPGVLWEHSASEPGWAALGHIYAEPRLLEQDGRSLLLTGNGYGSASGQAALLVVDAISGDRVLQLDLPARQDLKRGNGLSALTLERDASGRVVAAYAGDLHGQLWQFDLSAEDPLQWRLANDGAPLFRAEPGQPLTAAPVLHYSAAARADLLLFGSGRLLAQGDPTSTAVQAFYAVRNRLLEPGQTLTPRDLQAQRVLPSPYSSSRKVTEQRVDWRRQAGWFLPLPAGARSSERVVEPALVQGGRVVFTSLAPLAEESDPCLPTVRGWLMMLTLDDGVMPPAATLDSDGDRQLDSDDSRVAGIALDVGLPAELRLAPGVAEDAEQPLTCEGERYQVAGSTGSAELLAKGRCQLVRIHWRQLQ